MTVEKEMPLDFKPINSGLGFHPFSDGLPYAPVSKTVASSPSATPVTNAQIKQRLNTGVGAMAAGSPSFSFPRISVPVAPPQPIQPAAPGKPAIASPARPTTVVKSSVAPTVEEALSELDKTPKFGFVYLTKRIMAYVLDTGLNIGLCAGGLALVLIRQQLDPKMLLNPGIAMISVVFLLVFNWALIAAQEIAFGTTLGKRAFGLVLRGSASALFLRAFFFVPSVGFCATGLLWGLVDRKKRCWHDLAVNLQPEEIAKL
jgi:hypothetical protein